ncbi:MAG TPA: DUF2934 domain-containing protein [Terriglobales bacterium]|nr:DUF2934 domain-containing protein [Terriglobales bacterium]
MAKPISVPSPKMEAVPSPEEIQEQIRHLAYALYEQRGREDGHDLDDWLQAESEVTGKAKAMTA